MPQCRWQNALVLASLLVFPWPMGRNADAKDAAVPPVIGASGDEYEQLGQLIDFYRSHEMPQRLIDEALRRDALIWPTDRDPLDIILRRTRALLEHLDNIEGTPTLKSERRDLSLLEEKGARIPITQSKARREAFDEAVHLRRAIALKNPLLDFNDIIFLTHHKQGRGDRHMVDQYEGHNAKPGGGVYILKDAFGPEPAVIDVLQHATVMNGRLRGQRLTGGSFISLELDYNAKKIYFAWTQAKDIAPDASWEGQFWTAAEAKAANKPHYYWSEETCYHVFKAQLDGTELIQLTDGAWNDFDPCVLPNGRIAFISERRGGFLRCGARPNPTYTLYGMMPDGSDILCLSAHETHEWHPSITHDGMIVYTRWDYVDRDSDIAHHPWICYPDGTDPRCYHGNYPAFREHRPWMELSIRVVPNSHKFVATAAPHHGENYGSLVLIDHRKADDGGSSQLQRITPEVHFPESELMPGVPGPPHKGGNRRGQVYGQAWPLSEDFCLCVYDPQEKHYGLYLLDSFGNKIHLYTDPEVPCLDPIPLKPRKRPPIIPSRTTQALADRGADADDSTATIAIMNVYDADFDWPAGTEIKAIRVVQLFPKTTRKADEPSMGVGNQSLGRGVLGTVPVEADGSVHFEAPPDIPLYFQALDGQGRAMQTMRSLTYVHRGERLTCIGCHEPKGRAPSGTAGQTIPLALQKPPRKLQRDVEGSWPLTFSRLVQPVIDKHCAACHQSEEAAPSLARDAGKYGWSQSYHTLAPLAWAKHGGNGWLSRNETSYSIPGKIGARGSKLLPLLEQGHYDVDLSPEELYRITLWLDLNSNFYGV
ncbi:MAG: hypothetical protein JSW27_12330, partial [Phycisphaerales bacterium]